MKSAQIIKPEVFLDDEYLRLLEEHAAVTIKLVAHAKKIMEKKKKRSARARLTLVAGGRQKP